MGEAAMVDAHERFGLERMLDEIERVYAGLRDGDGDRVRELAG